MQCIYNTCWGRGTAWLDTPQHSSTPIIHILILIFLTNCQKGILGIAAAVSSSNSVTTNCNLWTAKRAYRAQVSNTRPVGRIRPATSFYLAPDVLKRHMITFSYRNFKENILCFCFEGFKLNGFYVLIFEAFSSVQHFYTQINNNQLQRVLFNNIFGGSL